MKIQMYLVEKIVWLGFSLIIGILFFKFLYALFSNNERHLKIRESLTRQFGGSERAKLSKARVLCSGVIFFAILLLRLQIIEIFREF